MLSASNPGLQGRPALRLETNVAYDTLQAGQTYKFHSFTSTTVNRDVILFHNGRFPTRQRRVVWEILDVDGARTITTNIAEREVLIAPGTRVRILSKHQNVRVDRTGSLHDLLEDIPDHLVADEYIVAVVIP